MNASEPIRAPRGAVAWSPTDGWLYDTDELPEHVQRDDYLLVVTDDDGMVRGVLPHDRAPLTSIIRLDADVAEVIARLDDLADMVTGIDTAEATDVNELRARMTALVHRVDRLEGRAP